VHVLLSILLLYIYLAPSSPFQTFKFFPPKIPDNTTPNIESMTTETKTRKEVLDSHLKLGRIVLTEILEERFIERQPTKYKQRAARTQYQKLDRDTLKWESELSDERLITRSKTWYHGVHEQELVELICKVVGFRNKFQHDAVVGDSSLP